MDFWSVVTPTIISTTISTLTALHTVKRTEWSARVDEVTKDIRQFSDDARRYWAAPLKPEEFLPLSVTIRARFFDINRQLEMLEAAPGRSFSAERVSLLWEQVFDVATGGDFESPNRVIDGQRATNAAAMADELRMKILDCRRRSLRWWPW